MEEQPRPPPSPPQPPAQLEPEEMEPGTPEPDDGLDPITRSKLKAAKVMNKLAEVRPPENYVEQEDVPVYEEPKAVPRYRYQPITV